MANLIWSGYSTWAILKWKSFTRKIERLLDMIINYFLLIHTKMWFSGKVELRCQATWVGFQQGTEPPSSHLPFAWLWASQWNDTCSFVLLSTALYIFLPVAIWAYLALKESHLFTKTSDFHLMHFDAGKDRLNHICAGQAHGQWL